MPEGNARLSSQPSPYLRGAAHQPVAWFPWGREAFERARREDKPILLDVGAVWCHWCHVMDGESYDDAGLAQLINDRFVPVKVDRDERPDVDARYQKRVGAITGQGGWPLTAFLTPQGDVFYGGTYFPPTAKFGRPSFREVLEAVSDAYHGRREEILTQAAHIAEHAHAPRSTGEKVALDLGWVERRIEDLADHHDPVNGGWGNAPKFPHPSAIETLLAFHERRKDARVRDIIVSTLDGMARGGIRDHVGGGFHRYSVDARWHVPHFEKMLYDNAELLRNYLHAFRILGDARFADAARDIHRFFAEVLSDPAGGYRGSQDADVTFGDDGDFFTWTRGEIAEAVKDDAIARVLALHFGVADEGPMHHDPTKNVLHAVAAMDAIAEVQQRPVAAVERDLQEGLARLRDARARRKSPFVDPVLYANWNAMAVRAMLEYSSIMEDTATRSHALATLDRFLGEAYSSERGFRHTLGGAAMEGLFDDQAQMLPALLAAFHVTQDAKYLACAREVADLLLREFVAEDGAGFVDTARFARSTAEVAALGRTERPLQDSPSPSPNARALEGLLLLADVTGEQTYADAAHRAISALAPEAQRLGLFGAALIGVSLRLIDPPAKIVLAGPAGDAAPRALHAAALRWLPLGGTVVAVHGPQTGLSEDAIAFAAGPARKRAGALVCMGRRCLSPAFDAAALRERLERAHEPPGE